VLGIISYLRHGEGRANKSAKQLFCVESRQI
jgi:hypothetical protein